MRPIAPRYFGPDGLPCVFTSDDDTGATTVGYLVQDLGLTRFKVSDGTITRIVRLAQNLDDVSDLSHFPPATMTILLTLEDSSVEHIRYITSCRCSTLEGTSRKWIPTGDPTDQIGVISAPDNSDNDILMEDGSFWLLEDGSKWKMEPLPPQGDGFVLEQDGLWLLEDGTKWELET